jgi:hypothetical protein
MRGHRRTASPPTGGQRVWAWGKVGIRFSGCASRTSSRFSHCAPRLRLLDTVRAETRDGTKCSAHTTDVKVERVIAHFSQSCQSNYGDPFAFQHPSSDPWYTYT